MPLGVAGWIGVAGIAAGAYEASSAQDAAQQQSDNAIAAQQGTAKDQTQLGQEQLDFTKQQYADAAPYRDQASQTSIDVAKSQLAAQNQQTQIAADYNDYNKSTFRPLEQQIVSNAQGYDTAGRRADAVAGATSDVEQAYAGANAANDRALQRVGVTPNSGRMQSLMADQTIAKANAIAGASTSAVRNVETVGAARMADAANLGRNLPSSQAVAANSAITAGNSASSNAGAALADQNAGVSGVQAGYSGAVQANSSAGSLYGQAASAYNSIANANAGTLGAIGSSVGKLAGNGSLDGLGTAINGWAGTAAAMANGSYNTDYSNEGLNYGSDKNIKKNTGKPGNRMQALAQINATPVEKDWQYDPVKGGLNDGGATHTGPMAQMVRKTMGEQVAPGGKKIDVASMNGKLLLGIQALTEKVNKLEKRRAS